MGVYIKGMEMPKEGNWKTIRIYPDGTCAVTDMSVDDLLCACDVLGYECDACDEDYCHLRCPLAEKAEEEAP